MGDPLSLKLRRDEKFPIGGLLGKSASGGLFRVRQPTIRQLAE
jgi:hypothetical protein